MLMYSIPHLLKIKTRERNFAHGTRANSYTKNTASSLDYKHAPTVFFQKHISLTSKMNHLKFMDATKLK